MVTRQGEIRGSRELVDLILVPRPVTRLFLLASLIGIGELAWQLLDYKLLSYLSGVLGPFCLLCATAIWSMRDKVDMVLEGEHLDATAFMAARSQARNLRNRSMRRATWVAVCALAAGSAAISANTASVVWHWMIVLAGAGTAESIYGYMIADTWESQLRAQRDKLTLEQKLRNERDGLVDKIERSRPNMAPRVVVPPPSSRDSFHH